MVIMLGIVLKLDLLSKVEIKNSIKDDLLLILIDLLKDLILDLVKLDINSDMILLNEN